ncbi:tissue factor pathway inhibitor 2 isoform X2 [Latimeria chalumnae]|uniref:tissue factor pathway inhibitor 2 isoform X2 n=1 Tax=Latimeria chalumnae TaxID=7897 RepID=UPI0006D90726|nr:PREDICTED: tissue factor pathway inhibitor 2-like isoform X2 [Latimeria chalumnae]|eukprot:XP_014354260.1 PREDICTED: tissue factor pathway inhibitor 2-like isoform X2 [Latimeria chalumnae]
MEFSVVLTLVLAVWVVQGFGKPFQENEDICLLPQDEGPCRALFLRYYYNTYTRTCETFYYGGCEGNNNNFASLEDCEKSCMRIRSTSEICLLPQDEGPCRALHSRYYYNKYTQTCEEFYYGGCEGNENNFETLEGCEKSCMPIEKRENNKVLNTKLAAENTKNDIGEVCLLPQDEGPCRALFLRYYYNTHTQTCEEFFYGGCEGNGNKFASLEDCEKSCRPIEKTEYMVMEFKNARKPNVKEKKVNNAHRKTCSLPKEEGPCKARLPRYYFDKSSQTCERFFYGGCEGNDNKFETLKDCENSCMVIKSTPSFCNSPKEEGSCYAAVTRYYYNPQKKACEEFSYSGCGGNANNFVSKKVCSKMCKKDTNKQRRRRVKFQTSKAKTTTM